MRGQRSRASRSVDQRIGPALKVARFRQGLGLDEVAIACAITPQQLARIEQGRREVSFPLLLQLATELDLDPLYFTSYQESALQIEERLRRALLEIQMPPEAVSALLTLSVEAQGALVDGLRWLTVERDGRPFRENAVVHHILDFGVGNSLDAILAGVAEYGIDPTGLWRSLAQIEELPGERCVLSDRLLSVTTLAGGQIDPLDVHRGFFGQEPENANAIRLWARMIGAGVAQNVQRHDSRTIYPLATVCRYIDTGEWGDAFVVENALIERHIQALIQTLRSAPNFRIGFLDDDVPFCLLLKKERDALVYTPSSMLPQDAPARGVAYRFSRADVARRFGEYFDELWMRIPSENKDSLLIADWLEQRIAARR